MLATATTLHGNASDDIVIHGEDGNDDDGGGGSGNDRVYADTDGDDVSEAHGTTTHMAVEGRRTGGMRRRPM